MTAPRMHEDEVPTDEGLVRRLLRAQFPAWADLPIAPPLKVGTDNAIFRLGADMSVRLPRIDPEGQVGKVDAWLPRLGPHLPLRTPEPLAAGEPGEGFPFPWTVHSWLAGRTVSYERLADPVRAAESLAAFLVALQAVDSTGGPTPGASGSDRGAALATRDERVRVCVDQLGDLIDRRRVLAAWEAALAAPEYEDPPVWVHGDLSPGNLIERDGEIDGVIDFGCMAIGDPACDLIVARNLLRGESRSVFRRATGVDEATWLRGAGWGLSVALIALPYYLETNPAIVASSWSVLHEVLEGQT